MIGTVFHCDPPKDADSGKEAAIQRKFINRMKEVAPGVLIAAVPNGGKRGFGAQAQIKQEGVLAGWPDLICLWPGGSAFLEFKAKAGRISDNQHVLLNRIHGMGHHCAVVRSVDTAVRFMKLAGAPFTGTVQV